MNFRHDLSSKRNAPTTAMVLSVSEHRDAMSVTRTMLLDGTSIYFKIIGPKLPPKLELYDFAVIASVFTAMRKNRPLHILGPVSSNLLRNLEEFQEIWAAWLPKDYHIVPITAEKEVQVPDFGERRGVFAFSGGLDSTFSLLRHTQQKAGRQNIKPALAVLVQGFDLPLGNDKALHTACQTAQSMLDVLNVPFGIVETNWKRDLCHNWKMEHLAGLAACLNQFNNIANVAVIGADDEGYDKVSIPWGSNPVSNSLLSSGVMGLRTEGYSYRRTERLAFVAENSDIASKIRVCWESADTGRNCGICEKCIRTQLNFRAIGMEPQGFDKKAGFFRIAMIPTRSACDNNFLLEAQKAAGRRGIRGAWRVAGYLGITKNFLLSPVVLAKSKLKEAIRRNEQLYTMIKKRRHV